MAETTELSMGAEPTAFAHSCPPLPGGSLNAAELARRPSRSPDYATENRALLALAEAQTGSPHAVLEKLVTLALDLCQAGSAGVSVLEEQGGRQVFRWHAIAGAFAANVGRTMPRESSPCGTVVDQEAVLLFQHPERHFAYPVAVDPPIAEALLVPFKVDGKTTGTVWVIDHSSTRKFDSEDARLLTNLSRFASTAVQAIARANSKLYTDDLLEAQQHILELIVQGRPLVEVLKALCKVAEERAEGSVRAAILLLDQDGRRLRTGAAPSLPDEYNRAIDGIEVGYEGGTCAAAVARGEVVLTTDIAASPGWAGLSHLPLALGLKAAWSTPILSSERKVLGTFETYFADPREPTAHERRLVEVLARTAALAIERRDADDALRRSEERFRALVTATSDIVYRMSADWEEMQPLDGRGLVPSSDSPLRGWMDRNLPAFEHERVRAELARVIAARRPFEMEHQVVRADGSLGWTFSRAVPLFGDSGEVAEWFGMASDITQQKQAEAELTRVRAESDQRARLYETILSNTPDFGYVFDLDHRFTYANEVLLRMWGKSWNEAIGKTCLELGYEPWHAAMHDREIETVKATQQPIRGEVHFTGTFGRRIYEYIFVPVLGPDGEVEAIAGTTRDVTERKQEEERQKFLANLATASQPLTEPAELMAVAARLLAEHLDVDRCAYAEIEDENVYVITGDHTRGVSSIVGRWPVAAFGAVHHRMMKANEPYVVTDADADPRIDPADLPAYRATAIQAVICVPLHKDEKFTAAMAVHQKVARQWTPDEVELVRTVVGRCWEALERARVVRQHRASEEQLRLVTDTVPALIAFVDAEKRYGFVNRQYEAWFNRPRSEIEGRYVWEVVGAEAYERLRSHTERGLSGERVEFEAFAPYPSGGRHIHAAFIPQFDGDKVVGYFSLITDVTERTRAVEALQDADRRKDEFIALLAHELRNPLAPLRNGLQVIKLVGNDAQAAEQARQMMDRQLGHMVRLIDDLLDVSRISRGKLTLRRERQALRDVVNSAVETARPAIEAAGHELILHLPSDPVFVDGDLTRLGQVFSNLLTNAAKFTDRGGRIVLSAERRDDQIAVSVADTGIGIPAEALPSIFDMFSQVDRTLERSTGGLGIGLALVKGLTEMHGGRVSAASPGEGRGSTFTVTLPIVLSAGRPRARRSDDDAHARRLSRRVLVVDDNRDSAESMSLMLGLLGSEVRMAHDGLEAIKAAEAFRPEVILMDIGMPRLNGFDATRRIREQSWGRDTAIVALTGWGQSADRQKSKEAGCDGHLVKPVELRDLERLLAGLDPMLDSSP
jgi:PAS domain S-box-containing protein